MDTIVDPMRNTHLDDPFEEEEQLLFSPGADSGLRENALKDIPRYLFRVASSKSDGETNTTWVRSKLACRDRTSSLEDIFSLLSDEKRTTVARTLNMHLRWWPGNPDDNFVSWTSSLLFVLQYIYYRYWSEKYGSSLKEIGLYVIDTKQFPLGTFIRDLDLIDTFSEYDNHLHGKGLDDLRSLRNRPNYYFGEYLSQGSLKIESKCQIICAEFLFEHDRLRRLQPRFFRT